MTSGSKARPSALAVTKQIAFAMWGGATDPNTTLGRKLNILGGFLASGARVATGTVVGRRGERPAKNLVLWDFERCPHSRMVREALSKLDLDAEIRPCPKGGTRYRGDLEGKGVPRLEDPNTGVTLSGSKEIVAHLYQHYGKGKPPGLLNAKPVVLLTGLTVRLLTAGRGAMVRPSRAPAQPLELYSFESSPYCRLARAAFTELEIPYTLHNIAKGSPKRAAFIARAGRMQVPWMFDPNTQTAMFESEAIERYLESTYGTAGQ